MRAFHCDVCSSPVFFENVRCTSCGHPLGFLPDALELHALKASGDRYEIATNPVERGYRLCSNGREHGVCNWLVGVDDPDRCRACGLNATIPDLSMSGNLGRWQRLEFAKHRLVYTLLALELPLEADGPHPALRFHFVGTNPDGSEPMTGHANGTITINIAEADDAERERRRIQMGEPFRTLLGHFRHEVCHFYWERLIAGSARLGEFRRLFGDERVDYGGALQRHHREGAPSEWSAHHISAYATMHAWEDWAETGAHYLHLIDMMETAASFGLSAQRLDRMAEATDCPPGPIRRGDFDALITDALPLTTVLNELNRGMGLPDVYPFVVSPPVIEKLRFVHDTFTSPNIAIAG